MLLAICLARLVPLQIKAFVFHVTKMQRQLFSFSRMEHAHRAAEMGLLLREHLTVLLAILSALNALHLVEIFARCVIQIN